MALPPRPGTGAALSFALLAFASLSSLPSPTSLQAQSTEQIVQDLVWRNIGPANMAGRVTDIDAV